MTLQHSTVTVYSLIVSMREYGGEFVKRLAHAMVVADQGNLRAIEDAFPEIIERYAAMVPREETQEDIEANRGDQEQQARADMGVAG